MILCRLHGRQKPSTHSRELVVSQVLNCLFLVLLLLFVRVIHHCSLLVPSQKLTLVDDMEVTVTRRLDWSKKREKSRRLSRGKGFVRLEVAQRRNLIHHYQRSIPP